MFFDDQKKYHWITSVEVLHYNYDSNIFEINNKLDTPNKINYHLPLNNKFCKTLNELGNLCNLGSEVGMHNLFWVCPFL